MTNRIGAWAAALAFTLACSTAAAADLVIEVKGVASDKGNIVVALYDADGWAKTTFRNADDIATMQFRGATAPAVKGVVSLTMKNVPPGDYAVNLYHDENANGKIDTVLGIASEPYAFSNDARGFLGPPTFGQAKFNVSGEKTAIVINLN